MASSHGIARVADWQSSDALKAALEGLGYNVRCRHHGKRYIITWHSTGNEPACYNCKPEDQCPRSGYCEHRK